MVSVVTVEQAPALSLEDLSHALSGANLDVIQLGPGALESKLLNAQIGELSVDCGVVNRPLRIRGPLDSKRCGLGLIARGARATYNGEHVDSSTLLLTKPGLELDGYFHEDYGWTTLFLPASWLESMEDVSKDNSFLLAHTDLRNLRPDPDKLRALSAAVETMLAVRGAELALPAGSKTLARQLTLDVRNTIGEVLCDFDAPVQSSGYRTLSKYRIAQRAERLIRAQNTGAVCIDDLCSTLRVSRRSLEYAFVDAFGTSPSRYSRLLRMHEVRRRLQDRRVSTTVTRAALDHGFRHLGLFATQYHALFAETPSTTLRS